MANKVDSNKVGLRYAIEPTLGALSGSDVWYPLMPNSYGEFGSSYKTVARDPINASRQRRKGVITDKDTVAGINIDFTQDEMYNLFSGFMFAAWRNKPEKAPATVTSTAYTVASGGTAFIAGDLIFAQNFGIAGNNGLKAVTSSTSTTVLAAGLAAETAPATALITKVGIQGGAGDITVSSSGGVTQLTSTTFDFTSLGLIPGEWIYIGGDATAMKFATAANNGWARVKTIAAHALVLDRFPGVMVTDAGTGKTIQLFIGHFLKNESLPANIVQKSYALERDYGTGDLYEYILGAVPNTLDFAIKTADKVSMDMGFVAMNSEDTTSRKAGTFPASSLNDNLFSASSDMGTIRLLDENANVTLATYITDLKLTINNNVDAVKAISTLGGFDIMAGGFNVAGSVKAFFSSSAAVAAIQNNSDVSLDFALVNANIGWRFDIPRITLGDGRRTVEKDKCVEIDLKMEGVAHETLDHTLSISFYRYLPNAAN